MSRTAYQWGLDHGSCKEALEWRKSLGTATQRTAWRRCERPSWLFWQLRKGLTQKEYNELHNTICQAANNIADHAVQTYCLACGVTEVEAWAREWLSGKDRTYESAIRCWRLVRTLETVTAMVTETAMLMSMATSTVMSMVTETEMAMAMAMEMATEIAMGMETVMDRLPHAKLYTRMIRREIPKWPGEV